MLGLFKPKRKTTAGPAKILIVDDKPEMRDIINLRLSAVDYITVTAENGKEALVKASSEKPDLILLDVNMPVMNGHEFLESVQCRPDLKKIPIIMVTTTYKPEDIAFAAAYGIADYVVKPFSHVELIDKVSDVLKR